MSEYKIPNEYYFRIHHVRPRFKGDIENVLIYMAEELTAIGEKKVDEFIQEANAAIYRYPGNAHRELKTINNWRTEISALSRAVQRVGIGKTQFDRWFCDVVPLFYRYWKSRSVEGTGRFGLECCGCNGESE